MELIGRFDDGFFDHKEKIPPEERVNSHQRSNYVPKKCTEEWFFGDVTELDFEDDAIALKFRADNYYSKQKFNEAIENYEKVVALLGRTNLTMKRDCIDGLIRSLIKIEKLDEALSRIADLVQLSKSQSQMCSVWKLTSIIHRLNCNFKDETDSLLLLLNRQPANFLLWLQLARSYANLYDIKTVFGSSKTTKSSNCTDESSLKLVAACLIRVRILVDSVENNPQFLNYSRNKELRKQITQQLATFALSQIFVEQAQNFMSRNLVKDDKSDFEHLSKLKKVDQPEDTPEDISRPIDSTSEFKETWFGWIRGST